MHPGQGRDGGEGVLTHSCGHLGPIFSTEPPHRTGAAEVGFWGSVWGPEWWWEDDWSHTQGFLSDPGLVHWQANMSPWGPQLCQLCVCWVLTMITMWLSWDLEYKAEPELSLWKSYAKVVSLIQTGLNRKNKVVAIYRVFLGISHCVENQGYS